MGKVGNKIPLNQNAFYFVSIHVALSDYTFVKEENINKNKYTKALGVDGCKVS